MSEPTFTLFDSDTGMTALKWGITILIAGFIAQFGKKFATFLIDRVKRLKSRKESAVPPAIAQPGLSAPVPSLPAEDTSGRRTEMKYNKKMLKALAKERKKR